MARFVQLCNASRGHMVIRIWLPPWWYKHLISFAVAAVRLWPLDSNTVLFFCVQKFETAIQGCLTMGLCQKITQISLWDTSEGSNSIQVRVKCYSFFSFILKTDWQAGMSSLPWTNHHLLPFPRPSNRKVVLSLRPQNIWLSSTGEIRKWSNWKSDWISKWEKKKFRIQSLLKHGTVRNNCIFGRVGASYLTMKVLLSLI